MNYGHCEVIIKRGLAYSTAKTSPVSITNETSCSSGCDIFTDPILSLYNILSNAGTNCSGAGNNIGLPKLLPLPTT